MTGRRTTLILDDEADAAARELADYYGCPVPDAIRRSLIAQRDSLAGVPGEIRQQRVDTLQRLFDLFEGNDAAAEVRRLKAEDQGF
jgi:hypothetical protein